MHEYETTTGPAKSDILTVDEAAQILRVCTKTLYEALRRGDVPGRQIGRRWIISRRRLMRWIEGKP